MSSALTANFKNNENKRKRCLSSRIVSRWYRSPEVILTEKDYDTSIDIWSMGCILAETLTCSQLYIDNKLLELGYQNDKARRADFITKTVKSRFFFEGNSCYPISPVVGTASETNIVSSDD